MRHIQGTMAGIFVASAICATAQAQERRESYLQEHVRAPSNALELRIGTAYTQGFGNVAPATSVDRVAGAGFGVGLDVDYRMDHNWSFGVEGQYQEFQAGQSSSSRGMVANLGATYHFLPVLRGDPWLRLGTGYRWLWENDPVGASGITVLRHGFELATLKVGYDVRVSEDVALAPVIGTDLSVFAWEAPSNGASTAMSTAQVATFVYAGLQGRFDLGGDRDGVPTTTARQPAPVPIGVTERQAEPPPPVVEQVEPASPAIAVGEDLMRACMLHIGAVEKAPKFEFDRAELQASDQDVLRQIGDCFTTGPLKDAKLRLVGRADPRGTVEYNEGLGLRRAKEVSTFLESLGVDASRIEQESRGKLDALGTDEATWAIDRRVDVLLSK